MDNYFKELIISYKKELLKRLKVISLEDNKEEVKEMLVEPFLELLQINTNIDLTDFSTVNAVRLTEEDNPYDYAIKKDSSTIAIVSIVSTKNLASSKIRRFLEKEFNQNREIQYAIITNGEQYYFFSDTRKYNEMDSTPLFHLDLLQNYADVKHCIFPQIIGNKEFFIKLKKKELVKNIIIQNEKEILHHLKENFEKTLSEFSDEFTKDYTMTQEDFEEYIRVLIEF